MKSLKRFFARLRNFAAKRRSDERLREEMQEHLVLQTEENIRAGMTPVEARRHALLRFGAVEAIREDYHAEKGLPLLENLLHDTRFAVRILRKSPGFTIIALLTLALGIGATTALFSVVDAVVLKPLPFPTADLLVHIESVIEVTGHGDVASYPDFLDWRARNHVTDGMAAFRTGDFTLIGAREPVHLQGAVVSAQLFSLLGAVFCRRKTSPLRPLVSIQLS
jgi:hypothetical protein